MGTNTSLKPTYPLSRQSISPLNYWEGQSHKNLLPAKVNSTSPSLVAFGVGTSLLCPDPATARARPQLSLACPEIIPAIISKSPVRPRR